MPTIYRDNPPSRIRESRDGAPPRVAATPSAESFSTYNKQD